jgi:hypothetical protein
MIEPIKNTKQAELSEYSEPNTTLVQHKPRTWMDETAAQNPSFRVLRFVEQYQEAQHNKNEVITMKIP